MLYSAIRLNSDQISFIKNTSGKNDISPLSRINLFIGPNNSGKSTLLRWLFSNPATKQEVHFKEIDNEMIFTLIKQLKKDISNYCEEAGIIVNNLGFLIDSLPSDYIPYPFNIKQCILDNIHNLCNAQIDSIQHKSNYRGESPDHARERIRNFAKSYLPEFKFLKNLNSEKEIKEHIYIPTLRGLRGIDYQDKKYYGGDNYEFRTKTDYFKHEENLEGKIYTGLNFYNETQELLLGGPEERNRIKKFEKFIGDTFFDGKQFSIIPKIKDNVVHIKIGDDDDFPIYKLGEGLQSIIILTYPLFFIESKNLSVFYEEPDMFLHPGFQRIFIETISRKEFESFQFFMTTHSNHFLDMTLDFSEISVFAFHKIDSSNIEFRNINGFDNNLLQSLGVRNSSVFTTNCTIWVEGITDRLYIRHFIKLLQLKESKDENIGYKEDIHFSFVEYGGNNITHWSFLDDEDPKHPNINVQFLCGKIFLITDRDSEKPNKNGQKSKKTKRKELLQQKLGDKNYYCLECKEIENLVIEKVLIETIDQFEKLPDSFDPSAIKYKDYQNEYLGEYIDAKFNGLTRKFGSESGTIKDKVTFAKTVIDNLTSFDQLSEEAKKIATKVLQFIKENN